MTQESGRDDETERSIVLEKNPTPDDEGGIFSTSDEKRQVRKNEHDLALIDRQLGWLGRITGSTDSSLNIAWFIAAFLLIALLFCLIVSASNAQSQLSGYIDKIISVIAAIAGYIFGSSRSRDAGSAP